MCVYCVHEHHHSIQSQDVCIVFISKSTEQPIESPFKLLISFFCEVRYLYAGNITLKHVVHHLLYFIKLTNRLVRFKNHTILNMSELNSYWIPCSIYTYLWQRTIVNYSCPKCGYIDFIIGIVVVAENFDGQIQIEMCVHVKRNFFEMFSNIILREKMTWRRCFLLFQIIYQSVFD